MEHLPRLLAVARGDEPPDLVLAGGRVIDTFTGESEDNVDVAIAGGRVAGVGPGYACECRIGVHGHAVFRDGRIVAGGFRGRPVKPAREGGSRA